MASSSSSASSSFPYEYHVFLNFRGVDTRKNFTSHLYAALCRKQIRTFMDDEEVKQGNEISPCLLNAIKGSKISIIIFSKNYASSKWCLDELVKILDCHKRNGQIVVPVFYHVDPSHVRKQEGTFRDVFVEYEEKEMPEKVQNWRAVLTRASNLAGWDSENFRSEAELVDQIVKDILMKLEKITISTNSNSLVGINSQIEQIKSLLCMELSGIVQIVGIWGMGGIGKTTLATAVFNQVFVEFEGTCFMPNVRSESKKRGGLQSLRKEIFSIIVGDRHEIHSSHIPQFTKERVQRMKVFIVLDDVNKVGQLNDLIEGLDQYGLGSRIIITTRDKGILEKFGVKKIYSVDRLKTDEAFELFCNYAFKENHCPEDLEVHSRRLVEYGKGNPLALKVLGSALHPKSKMDWENALDNLKEICSSDIYDIYSVLKISFKELTSKEKSIFLDIACFLVGKNKDFVANLLDDSQWYGLNVLINKSLIIISHNCVQMHDLLQEMGREIVREESVKEPGKRSRLWYYKDVRDVLKNNKGSEKIEGIFLNVSKTKDIHLASGAFTKMPNLRLLEIYNPFAKYSSISYDVHLDQGLENLPKELRYLYWFGYPLKTLPFNFNPKNLVELKLSWSNIEQLWKGKKKAFKLKSIDLTYANNLVRMPDLSKIPNLERIILEDCRTLACIPSSVQNFNHLSVLSLHGCKSLRAFPSNIHCGSPVVVDFSYCVNLTEFPQIFGNVIKLDLQRTAIGEVPSSIECLPDLKKLRLSNCTRLKRLSTNICKLKSLLELHLDDCENLESFPEILEKMEHLNYINLERTAITELPSSIENLEGLELLRLDGCSNLHSLPDNIGNLKSLKYIYAAHSAISQLPSSILDLNILERLCFSECKRLVPLPSLSSGLSSLVELGLGGCGLVEIPQDIGFLSSLKRLSLYGNDLVSLPTSINKLSQLEHLSLSNCYKLRSLPELPRFLRYLVASNCYELQSLPKLPLFLGYLDASNCYELRSLPELPLFLQYLNASNCYALRSLPEFPPCPEELDTSIQERLSMKNAARNCWKMEYIFTNCIELDKRGNMILSYSQPRIQQMAIASLSPSMFETVDAIPAVGAKIILPGSEIPGWLTYQSLGSSITIQLPQHCCSRNLIGFAFCVVLEIEEYSNRFLAAWCELEVKTLSRSVGGIFFNMAVEGVKFDHVVLGFNPIWNVGLSDGNHHTTLSFKLFVESDDRVECWGLCPVFANPNETNPNKLTLKFVPSIQIGNFDDEAGMSGPSTSVGSSDEEELELFSSAGIFYDEELETPSRAGSSDEEELETTELLVSS